MRKTLIVLLCCVLVLLGGYSAFRAYELWKQNHWMTLAKTFAADGDVPNEILCLKQVLHYNPRNVEACRMAANLADAAGSPDALPFRRKVVELDPTSVPDRLALAQTALIFRDYATVAHTLADVSPAGKQTSDYLNIAGEYAFAIHKPEDAVADFTEAARIDPSNPGPQLNLATVQLHSSSSLDVAQARLTLRRISLDSTNLFIRSQAQRELVGDALATGDSDSALEFSKELTQSPNALFPDKLLRLNVLLLAGSPDYPSFLASCEHEAAGNSDKLSEMGMWLNERKQPLKTLAWLHTLPENEQTNLPAALIAAQSQMQLQEWKTVQSTLSKENWTKLEYTRHAYLARAMRQQGLGEASKAEWDLALSTANNNPLALSALLRMTDDWKWSDETQQILWIIVNNYPQEQQAAQELAIILYQNGSTRPLMQLFNTELNRNPSDLEAKNNLALIAMLLHAQEVNPYALSQQVYQQNPTNAFFACTYAFSLHLQGKDSSALKVMQKLTPKELQNSSTAGYYGLILKSLGETAQANHYLQLSVKGKLLPEERTLFQQAL